jgi:hypothetical protein
MGDVRGELDGEAVGLGLIVSGELLSIKKYTDFIGSLRLYKILILFAAF